MFDTVGGLPVHSLVVHATVVVVPLAALAVLLAAVSPRFRRWAGLVPLAASLVALALVPVTVESGEALQERIGEPPLVEVHAELGDGLLPWVVGLVVVAAGLAWQTWRAEEPPAGGPVTGSAARPGLAGPPERGRGPRWLGLLLAVVAVLASVGTTVQVVRIGHSGATAVWSGVVELTDPPADDD